MRPLLAHVFQRLMDPTPAVVSTKLIWFKVLANASAIWTDCSWLSSYSVIAALFVAVLRALLGFWQYPFGLTEVDYDVALLESMDRTARYRADPLLVVLEYYVAFRLAYFLDDDLLRGLGGDAPELRGVHFFAFA